MIFTVIRKWCCFLGYGIFVLVTLAYSGYAVLAQETLLDQGIKAYSNGQFERSVQYIEQSFVNQQIPSLFDDQLKIYMILSDAYQSLGHYQTGIARLTQFIPIAEKQGTDYQKSLFYSTMGNLYLSTHQLNQAKELLVKALNTARLANSSHAIAVAYNIIGNIHAIEKDYNQALLSYEKAIKATENAVGHYNLKADILMNTSRIRIQNLQESYMQGNYSQIVKEMEEALDAINLMASSHKKVSRLLAYSLLAWEFNDELSKTETDLAVPIRLIANGEEFHHYGQFEHAALLWEEALSIIDKKKYIGLYMDTMMNLAELYRIFGQYTMAMSTYHRAIPMIRFNPSHQQNATFLSQMGDLYLFLENVKEALQYQRMAEDEIRSESNPEILALILHKQGISMIANRNFEGAISAYERCLIQLEKLDNPVEENLSVIKSDIREFIHTFRDCIHNVNEIRPGCQQYKNMDPISELIIRLTELSTNVQLLLDSYYEKDDENPFSQFSQQIHKELNRAIRFIQPITQSTIILAKDMAGDLNDSRLLSYAHALLGQQLEKEKQINEAIFHTRQAVFFAQEGNHTELLFQWQWQLGRLFRKRGDILSGDHDKAILLYQMAINKLTSKDSPSNCNQRYAFKNLYYFGNELINGFRHSISFEQTIRPVFIDLVEMRLNEGKKKKHIQPDMIWEALHILEKLKIAEMQYYFEDECILTNQYQTILEPDKLKDIDPNAAIIYPVVLTKEIVIFVIFPDGIQTYSVYVTPESLKRTVRLFRHELNNKTMLYKDYSIQLYNWLIRPYESELTARHIQRLVFIGDGMLQSVPIAALRDGYKYVIEKYAVVYLPLLHMAPPTFLILEGKKMLFGGCDDVMSYQIPQKKTDREDSIHVLSQVDVLSGRKQFQFETMQKKLYETSYGVIHIACPFIFKDTITQSCLDTPNRCISLNQIIPLFTQNHHQKDQTDILILSDSRTSPDNYFSVLGLQGFIIKTPIRSLIASMWQNSGPNSIRLINAFYTHLMIPNTTRAEALRQTQRQMMSSNETAHPGYWASFILIGSWL